jgi:hypothetical protein
MCTPKILQTVPVKSYSGREAVEKGECSFQSSTQLGKIKVDAASRRRSRCKKSVELCHRTVVTYLIKARTEALPNLTIIGFVMKTIDNDANEIFSAGNRSSQAQRQLSSSLFRSSSAQKHFFCGNI